MAENQPTNIENEKWRPVPGWEGSYEVSSHGQVRSIDRIITTKAGVRRQYQGRMLAPRVDRNGYLRVNLKRLGRAETKAVHRLVLEAFVGPCPEGQECCHNDGNPANDHLTNLRWDSPSRNELDKVRHGTHNHAAKTHCSRGHKLASQNLVLAQMKRGNRSCLACARARAYIQHRPGMKRDFQRISDSYYEKNKRNNYAPQK